MKHDAGPRGSIADSLRAHWALVVPCVLLQVGLGVFAARIYFAQHNTLVANGNWVSTKTTLARGLNGSYSFITGRQALAGEELDLGAWHGFQEIIYEQEIDAPRRIELDFELSPRADLSVLFNRAPGGGQNGIRLSASSHRPSCHFRAAADGEFLSLEPLSRATFASDVVHRVRIQLGVNEITVEVDGELVGTFGYEERPRQLFGFRGGARSVLIDDIEVVTGAGDLLTEDWDAAHVAPWLTGWLVAGVIFLNLLLYVLMHRFSSAGAKIVTFRFVLLNLMLLLAAGTAFVFVLKSAEWYPGLGRTLEEAERYFRRGAAVRVIEDIYTHHTPAPASGVVRMMFLGTSQTWGAGATRDDRTWVSVLDSLLNAGFSERRYECVNAGFSASHSGDLVPILRGALMPLEPRVVVINLGNNDRKAAAYEANLRSLVEIVRARGAQPVLVLEANEMRSITEGVKAMHTVMRHVGDELGLPVIDMNRLLRESDDTGFLWWDKVHFTDLGHRLMAQRLAEELMALGLPELTADPRATVPPAAQPPAPLAGLWDARVTDGYGDEYQLHLEIEDRDGALGGQFEVVGHQAGGTLAGEVTNDRVRLDLEWTEPCLDVAWNLIASRRDRRLVGGFIGAMCSGDVAAGWLEAERQ